jgi:hypothetical protein
MSTGFVNPRGYYEKHWIEERRSETSSRSIPQDLDRKDWRYYVIAYSGNGIDAYDFLRAANLVQPALNAFAHISTEGEFGAGEVRGWGGDQVHGVLAYEIPHSGRIEILDLPAALEMRYSYERFAALDKVRHEGISRAVDLLYGLRRISSHNDLRVLGLFAVIEMLLTHNPNDKEIGDSLSHQISTKIPLLSARFRTPIDYCVFNTDLAAESIWKRLYAYRSKIAHGSKVEFSGPLQLLQDRETAVAFLEKVTRRLVQHALDEPQLVDALKPI